MRSDTQRASLDLIDVLIEDESPPMNVQLLDVVAQGAVSVSGPGTSTPVPMAEGRPNLGSLPRRRGRGTGSTAITGPERALIGGITRRGRGTGRGRVGGRGRGRGRGWGRRNGRSRGGAALPR